MFIEADIKGEAATMFLPHLIDALLAFYGALLILFTYCACKPSCRLCLHRQVCPNRRRGIPQLLLKPICTTPNSNRPVSRPALLRFVPPSEANLPQLHTGR